jgi:CrcB protein
LFALRWDISQATRVFLIIGICGGYTTFSTFSLDAYALIQQSQYAAAAGYIVASVAASILALVTALHLVRML